MSLDEGYIKYSSRWTRSSAPDRQAAAELELSRAPLYAAGLIGVYHEHNIGFGNLSMRCGEPGQFLISGTQTGHLSSTNSEHYALVTAYDVDANSVDCIGPIQASSEAMTHAAIYQLDPSINAVVHVHSAELWHRYLHRLPTTNKDVAYGTPQMALEFMRLYRSGGFAQTEVAVMAGHNEGIIGIGATLAAAADKIFALVPG